MIEDLIKTIPFKKGQNGVPRSINGCLLAIGMPKERAYLQNNNYPIRKKSVYERMDKYEILAVAKIYYKESMKQHHPDVGGDAEYCTYLNQCYARIKKLVKWRH